MSSLLLSVQQDPRSQILLNCLGDETYAVGGAIRDSLREKRFRDIDFSVNYHPEEVRQKLESFGHKVIPTGLSHQTVTAILVGYSDPVEITSFRSKEMKPEGGVFLGSSIQEDLQYRDFSCNSIAMNLKNGSLIDPVGGIQDIKSRILRAVPDAKERFLEDPLRIMRMVRFSAELDFEIEIQTFEAAKILSGHLQSVAMERIRDEFSKIIVSNSPRNGLERLRILNFFKYFIPELEKCISFEQNKFHTKDVYSHTLDVVEISKPFLINRLSALFHDIGKPPSLSIGEDGERHFYLHEKIGAEMIPEIFKRLKYSKVISKAVEQLTYTHMRPINAGSGGLRRILRDTDPHYQEWRDLKEADTIAVLGSTKSVVSDFSDFDSRMQQVMDSPSGSAFKHLAITGYDLKELGFKEGPIFKEILHYCQELVLDFPLKNTKNDLFEAIRAKFLAKFPIL